MAQPKITKEKEKEIRDMEISSPVQDTRMLETNEPIEIDDNNEANNSQTNADTSSSPTLDKLITEKSKNSSNEPTQPKPPRRIQMLKNKEGYDVIQDLNTTRCNITFGELMDVAPKIRTKVAQGIKLEKSNSKIAGVVENDCATTVVLNNIYHDYESKSKEVNEDDIAMVDITVGVKVKALIDSCSNLSIITKKFLEKLPSKYEPIGISRGRIRLATMNDDYSESYYRSSCKNKRL